MDREEPSCPSPRPLHSSSSSSSSIFKDLSNFKTPKRPSHVPNFQTPSTKFFTSSKQTPRPASSFRRHRPSIAPSSSAASSKAARKLKAFETEQLQSSRKEQFRKEQSLKSLAKSLTVWLNFLFENPRSCGCDWPVTGEADPIGAQSKGKRDCRPNEAVGVGATWHCPKRRRDLSWQPVGTNNVENPVEFSNSKYSKLRGSLEDICSFDDLMQRMRLYLSLKNCEDVCKMMTQLTKNVDDGRLKMKVHCPIVTDVGLKKKATRILMCYSTIWLRIGLYIIFGGDSLLTNEDLVSDQETALLKMIIEKQFFAHSSLAKAYSYNKMVDGLYRPGYYENLGNIVLKRFLLLVLILDKAKCQSSLPSKYGIDGVDGGSPLLFKVQSSIKSSSQMIQAHVDFLPADVMHGEGNLISHLVIVGYKVSYQQDSLSEYSFNITDLFVDLQDGVRLCRALQIFLCDSSIMMKVVVPSDSRKKNLANCTIAMQNLKKAGVPLCDEDGMVITGDDIVDGDKELILSILWNMFVHLQLPLLTNKTIMLEEVCKIRGQENTITVNSTPLEVLLNWIKGVCSIYNLKIESFSALADGKGIWCLLDYYFRKELNCSFSMKDSNRMRIKESIMSVDDYPDAAHNFIMSSKLTKLLGNFPEILQISDVLEFQGVSSHRSVIIFLVFLASELIVNRSVEQLNFHKFLGCECQSSDKMHLCSERRLNCTTLQNREELSSGDFAMKFKTVQSWWQKMVDQNRKSLRKSNSPSSFLEKKNTLQDERESAVKVIQSHGRRYIMRQKYLKSINSIIFLQTSIRLWSDRKNELAYINLVNPQTFLCVPKQQLLPNRKYVMFTIDKQGFFKFKRSVLLIQQATRNWIARKNMGGVIGNSISSVDLLSAVIVIQKYVRGWLLRSKYICNVSGMEESLMKSHGRRDQLREAPDTQPDGKEEICGNSMISYSIFNRHLSAAKIQCNFRCWLSRRMFLKQKWAATMIQRDFRMYRCRKVYEQYKISVASVVIIQSFVRGWIGQRLACRQRHFITVIQSNCRGWLLRRHLIIQKEAVIKIQSAVRCLICWKAYYHHRQAAIEIQRFMRGKIVRSRLLGKRGKEEICRNTMISYSHFNRHLAATKIQSNFRGWLSRRMFLKQKWATTMIQRDFRMYRCRKVYEQHKISVASVIIVQSFVRGWVGQRLASRQKHFITVIQRNCRGWSLRRHLIIQKEAAIKIQSAVRCLICWKAYYHHRKAAIEIQRFMRGKIVRSRLIGASRLQVDINHASYLSISGGCCMELKILLFSVIKLQRWWRSILRSKSAVIIQSHTRGWIARRKAANEKNSVVVIQSYWRGYLVRKESKEQLLDLCLKLQQSPNICDRNRAINRLVKALPDLLTMRSVRGILYLCTSFGTIDTILKLIGSISRSIPDQEILKHALSTLRNITCYPHLAEVLIDTPGSTGILILEFLRNKEEVYFICSEILKRIWSSERGIEVVRKSPALIKRLHNLVDELTRKICKEKQNVKGPRGKENMERRLREAVQLLKLITRSER